MASCDRLQTLPAGVLAAGSQTPTPPYTVSMIFKARHYETGMPKTWLFTNIDRVDIVQGRMQLRRGDYGLVCDLPCGEVAHVYTVGSDIAVPCLQETPHAMNVRWGTRQPPSGRGDRGFYPTAEGDLVGRVGSHLPHGRGSLSGTLHVSFSFPSDVQMTTDPEPHCHAV